jgi:hypothetical protein
MRQTFTHTPYASGRLRALLTMLLLAAGAINSVLSLIASGALVGSLSDAGGLGAPDEFGETAAEMLYVGVALLQVVIFAATAFAFLMWLHRAYRNLPALGADGLATTPGWAVAYFFIPFVNLFKPFQVVREIWRESTPGREAREVFGGDDDEAARPGAPPLVGWWWALWLIANVAGRASHQVGDRLGTIEGMLLASWVSIASDALFVIAAALAIMIVKRIDEMQEAKFRGALAQRPPPPPESFETPRTA